MSREIPRRPPRQFPRWRDVEPFLRTRPLHRDPTLRRLARCLSLEDFERAALRPTAFGQVAAPDLSTTILGKPAAAPIALAPTGYTRLSHVGGEKAVAAAAAGAGLPYTLSTYATTSIAETAQAAPGGRNWFQVYLMKDRGVSLAHVEEAKAAGYEAVMLTIDTTVTGMKRKDKRNGFAIPPQLSARTVAGLARHPGWVGNILTTEPLRFATFPEGSHYGRWGMSNELREQAIRPADLTWLKERFGGPLVVKGVLSVPDAVAAVEAGQRGVTAVLDLLVAEMRRAMCLLGTPDVASVGPEHVRLRAS